MEKMAALFVGVFSLLLTAFGCSEAVTRHLVRAVPPPGGCDRCHHVAISADWKIDWSPVAWRRDAPPEESAEERLDLLKAVPAHERVPEGRLRVFAEGSDAAERGEAGTRCFACHRAPDEAHEKEPGHYPVPPHPWVRPAPP